MIHNAHDETQLLRKHNIVATFFIPFTRITREKEQQFSLLIGPLTERRGVSEFNALNKASEHLF